MGHFFFLMGCLMGLGELGYSFPWWTDETRVVRMERRGPEERPWNPPIPPYDCIIPAGILGEKNSFSFGSVVDGCVFQGSKIPARGPHHQILDNLVVRELGHGTTDSIELILDVAKTVWEAFPGSLLGVANIGRQNGGPIPYSVSHRAGRDIDLGFYLVDEEGNSVLLPELRPLRPPHGEIYLDSKRLLFDAPRNHALVKSLLSRREPEVQVIFVADFLKKILLNEAAKEGKELLAIYREKIRQPRGALAHDDHYHVRLFCSAKEKNLGCKDIVKGKIHMGSGKTFDKHLAIARKAISSSHPAKIQEGLAFLGMTQDRQSLPMMNKLLNHEDSQVVMASLDAIVRMGMRPSSENILKRLATTEDARLAERLFVELWGTVAQGAALPHGLLAKLIKTGKTLARDEDGILGDLDMKKRAAWFAAFAGRGIVPSLLELLKEEDEALLMQAVNSLALMGGISPWCSNASECSTPQAWEKGQAYARLLSSARYQRPIPQQCQGQRKKALKTCLVLLVASPDDFVSLQSQLFLKQQHKKKTPPLSLSYRHRTARQWRSL